MNFELSSVNLQQGIWHWFKRRLSPSPARQEQGSSARDVVGAPGDTTEASRELLASAEAFANLMEIAHRIAQYDARGLGSLVSAILRPLQSEQILSVAERPQHAARDAIRFDQLFSSEYFFSYFDPRDCLRPAAEAYQVDLSRDVVLTTPWVRKGFASALAHIGNGKKSGPWRQDPNHSVTLVLPWRIGIVAGGNHSIAAGILAHEGVVVPSDVVDLSPLFSRVVCDGTRFVCRATGKTVALARDGRMGALFEIGRLMTQSHGSQSAIPIPTSD